MNNGALGGRGGGPPNWSLAAPNWAPPNWNVTEGGMTGAPKIDFCWGEVPNTEAAVGKAGAGGAVVSMI